MEHLDAWSFQSKGMDLGEDLYFHYGAEEVADYRDPAELVAALKQKQEEVLLAAQLGNALLLENRQLKEHSDKLHEQYADKLEGLEQGKHELRLKLEGCQSQWESQVSELERDVRDLRFEVERLTRALAESERDRSRDREEHSERSQRLEELLSKAMEGERSMSSQLQSLKLQLQRRGGQSRQQDEELISAMREQVTSVKTPSPRLGGLSPSEVVLLSQGQNNPNALHRTAVFPIWRSWYQPPVQLGPCCTPLQFQLQMNLQPWVLMEPPFASSSWRTLHQTVNI